MALRAEFQFLIGSLESVPMLSVFGGGVGFQFLIGSLESEGRHSQTRGGQEFQFLIGSLESQPDQTIWIP